MYAVWRLLSARVDRGLRRWKLTLLGNGPDSLVAGARVLLEIGAGTGATLAYYAAVPGLERVILVEPNTYMHQQLTAAAAAAGLTGDRLELHAASADAMSFVPTGSVDVVVSTLVLCSVPSQAATLAEVHRVLRPGGRFVFMEHVAATDAVDGVWAGRLQRALTHSGFWPAIGDGCHLTRTTGDVIRGMAAAWDSVKIDAVRLRGTLPFVAPHVIGVATKCMS